MPRFFAPAQQLREDTITLMGENAAHAKVLRLHAGDEVTVCDGEGTDLRCAVESLSGGELTLRVLSRAASESEARVRCSVYMAFPKADKLEHVIQKATELGAAEIVCFPMQRCVSRPDEKSLPKKLERWQRIAASAAEQSGRGVIPRVLALGSYAEALVRASQASLALCFYENEDKLTLRGAIGDADFSDAAILTGPEGGFAPVEIEQARAAGLRICTLGRRILRCETAPLCALSALMYATGEF